MAKNIIICEKNNVDYMTIRKAMCQNIRTKEELKELTGVCLECQGCKERLEGILSSVCGCKNVSLKSVVEVVGNGVKTVEEIVLKTGAGADCGRCKRLIENVIELGR